MNDLKPFRFWCQKVLPLVYDDELSYYELLCKVVDYLNKTMENVNILSENFDELQQLFNTLKQYVDDYFKNLNVQEEINNKLDEMVTSGELQTIITRYFKLGKALYLGNSYLGGVGSTTGKNGIYANTNKLFYQSDYKASSGCGFNLTSLSTTTFQNLIEEFNDELDTGTKNNVTHIIVLSAMGDSRYVYENNIKNYSGLTSAITTFTTYCHTHFPNAEVYIAFCDTILNDSINSGTNGISCMFVHHCLKYLSGRQKFNYLGWIGWTGYRNQYCISNDGYHPNDNGYNILSTNFIESLTNHYEYILKRNNIRTLIGESNYTCLATPDYLIIEPNNTNTFSLTANKKIDFIDLSNSECFTRNNNFSEMLLIRRGNNELIPTLVQLNNQTISITPTITAETVSAIPFIGKIYIPTIAES